MKRKIFNFEVTIGKKIDVTVLSDEDDSWGDRAKRLISNGIEDVQHISLPSSVDEITIEGDTVEEIGTKANAYMGGWNSKTLVLNDKEDYENPYTC